MTAITTTSPVLLPAPATPAPAAGTTEETRPSGLVVVRNELSPVTTGAKLVVVDHPLTGNDAVDAARAAHAELAAAQGPAAADIMFRDQLELAQQIRSDEIRNEAIAALLAGDLGAATRIISNAG